MSTADFEDIFASKIPSACHMMIQLDGRPVGLILGLKFQRFPFWRPVAIVDKRDRVTPDAPAEILIPDFPECLFEEWHGFPFKPLVLVGQFYCFTGFSSSFQRDGLSKI